MKKPELLSPAGDMEKLKIALNYGADAVYFAGAEFGMRTASGNFDEDLLSNAVSLAHKCGARAYVACNTMPRNGELKRLPAFMERINDACADAVIVADLGVLRLSQRYAPNAEVHISTQVSVTNYNAARAWHELGASRIVLARELSLDEITDIRAHTDKKLELEAFVHGAMCMSYSGRCLLSGFMTGRDSNRGNCAQPCRWKYSIMEEKRPGQYFDIIEDGGSYILNSKDLCMVSHIPELVRAGIDSFKIEGRVKSSFYCATVTNAYRMAIDSYVNDVSNWNPDGIWASEVEKVSHREYSTGFYFDSDVRQHAEDSEYIRNWDVVAVVEECDAEGNAVLSHRNRISVGDLVELISPGNPPVSFCINDMENEEGEPITCALHPKMLFKLKLPCSAVSGSMLRHERGGE